MNQVYDPSNDIFCHAILFFFIFYFLFFISISYKIVINILINCQLPFSLTLLSLSTFFFLDFSLGF